jgi:hypothetical protein
MTDINLLLELKKINTNLYKYLIEITDKITDIKTSNDSYECKLNTELTYLLDEYKIDIISVKEFVKHFNKDLDIQINQTCIHEIVEDDIDIGENSQRIRYCTICETTFH